MRADTLHADAVRRNALLDKDYLEQQAQLYQLAIAVAGGEEK